MEVEENYNLDYVKLLEARLNEMVPRNATARSVALILTDIWMATIKNGAARSYLTRDMAFVDKVVSLKSLKQFTGEAIRKTSYEWVLNLERSFVMTFAALTLSNRKFVGPLLVRHPTLLSMVYAALSKYGPSDSLVATWGAGFVANVFHRNDTLDPREAVTALKKVLCEGATLKPHAVFAVAVALRVVGSTEAGLGAVTAENVISMLERKRDMHMGEKMDGESDIDVALRCLKRLNPEMFEGYLIDDNAMMCKTCAAATHLNTTTLTKVFFDKFECECSLHPH